MATELWLQDNPKILAYVSRDLHNKLCQFRKKHKIKSISEAINLILKNFFELEIDLPRSVDEEETSSSENSIKSRIAVLENGLRHLADSVSAVKDDLSAIKQTSFIQASSSEKGNLLSGSGKPLDSQTEGLTLPQLDSPLQNEDRTHLLQKNQGNLPTDYFSKNKEFDDQEIDRLVPVASTWNSVNKDFSNSSDDIQVLDEFSQNSLVDFVGAVEGNLLSTDQKTLSDGSLEKSNLLSINSESLNSSASNSYTPHLNSPLQNHDIHPLQENQECFVTTEIDGNKKLNREGIDRSVYWKGVLGLLNRESGLANSPSEVRLLAKSIFSNSSCVQFSILKKSRLIKMIEPYQDIDFQDLEYYSKQLNKERKTPYCMLRDSLNKQLTDAKNPLSLDCEGKNIIIPRARDLAVLVKQLRENDDVFQVYVISLSMLSRILNKAGFPATPSNLLKIRKYVEEVYQEVMKSLYTKLLERVRLYRKWYGGGW